VIRQAAAPLKGETLLNADSTTNPLDDELAAFAEEQDHGTPWIYPVKDGDPWDPGMPNPLVVRVTGISDGTNKRGEPLTFLHGFDTAGERWSRILGTRALREELVEGVQKEWNDELKSYVETGRIGPVQPGDLVSILYRGHRKVMNGPNRGESYPDLKIARRSGAKPAAQSAEERFEEIVNAPIDPELEAEIDEGVQEGADDASFPF
jgi:hypothetical protein